MLFARHLYYEVMLATLMKIPARRPGKARTLATYFLNILNRIGCQASAASFGNSCVPFGALDAWILDLYLSCTSPVGVEFRARFWFFTASAERHFLLLPFFVKGGGKLDRRGGAKTDHSWMAWGLVCRIGRSGRHPCRSRRHARQQFRLDL